METDNQLITSKYIKPFKINERVKKFIIKVDEDNKIFYVLPNTSLEVLEYILDNIYKGYSYDFDYLTYFESCSDWKIDHENKHIIFSNDLNALHYKSLIHPSLSKYKNYKKYIYGETCGSFLKDIPNIELIGLLDLTYYDWKMFKENIDLESTWDNLKILNHIFITNSYEQFQLRDVILEKYPNCKVKVIYR